jgi:hypothetical protein
MDLREYYRLATLRKLVVETLSLIIIDTVTNKGISYLQYVTRISLEHSR